MAASEGKNQNYNLKWTNHTSNILQMFIEHLHKESLVDVTLACEGQFIKAHKMVLSACSPYFQELFTVHPADHPYIIMNGMKYVTLQQMIDFMYEGEIRVADEDLDNLLITAENLQVKGLCKIRKERAAALERNEEIKNSLPSTEKQSNTNGDQNQPKSRKRRKQSHSPILNQSVEGTSVEPQFSTSNNHISNVEGDIQKSDAKVLKLLSKHGNSSQDIQVDDKTVPGPKIPRPPNAFMIFANEWRKKLAVEHQGESNKEISVRLGNMWKSLPSTTKDLYYLAAKKADEDHKVKYPGYYYSPKEARLRKEMRGNNSQKTSNILTNSFGVIKDIDTTSLVTLVMPDTTDENEEVLSCDGIKEEPESTDDLFESSDSNGNSGNNSPNSQLPSTSSARKQ
ncbi:hypothetical protein ILUMI_00210 [Ignelater luminosus]|uniref:Uncharacterized protein n=1 Tax=Ignelater luminosus TaxID=2038154 RepID=A0A8K0DHR2_IGNLU|nr:hypothetical protein ILUMI_00210 [Ignelater luminosus]